MATETTLVNFIEGAAASTPSANRVVTYAKSDGLMYSKDDAGAEKLMSAGANNSALVFLEAHTASASATLDFTTFISSTYDEYQIEFVGVVPATNAVAFWMRMGTGGGPTYDTGANYGWMALVLRAGASAITGAEGGATKIQLGYNTDIDNTSTWSVNGTVKLFSPQSTALYKWVDGSISYQTGGFRIQNVVGGTYETLTALTAVRFLFSSGNIASGTIRVYGIAKS